MTDRHKYEPFKVRPKEADRVRLVAYVAKTGRAVNAILAQALHEFLERNDNETEGELWGS